MKPPAGSGRASCDAGPDNCVLEVNMQHKHQPPRQQRIGSKRYVIAQIVRSIIPFIEQHAKKQKRVGFETQHKRKRTIVQCFEDLWEIKHPVTKIRNLKQCHIKALVELWEERKLSPVTIDNRLSMLRVACTWFGKPGMVLPMSHYVSDLSRARVIRVAIRDKSWSGNGVDPVAKIGEVMASDREMGMALLLMFALGARRKEGLMYRPSVADRGACT